MFTGNERRCFANVVALSFFEFFLNLFVIMQIHFRSAKSTYDNSFGVNGAQWNKTGMIIGCHLIDGVGTWTDSWTFHAAPDTLLILSQVDGRSDTKNAKHHPFPKATSRAANTEVSGMERSLQPFCCGCTQLAPSCCMMR